MATSLSSLLGGIYTGPSGVSGYSGTSGFSGAGVSGFSGFSGAGGSGFSGFSGAGGSGFSGASGFSGGAFNGGTITNPLFINNATVTTSAGDGALEVLGGVGIGQNIALSGILLRPNAGTGTYIPAVPLNQVGLQQDVSIIVTTLANLSGFSFPLTEVNATYSFQFFITYRGGTTGASLGVGLTFPGAVSFAATYTRPQTATAQSFNVITTSGTKVQSTSVPAANTDYVAFVYGTIRTSVSGTLTLQVASGVAAATTSVVTIRRGTVGMLWRMG
jgi:hypothetical protein